MENQTGADVFEMEARFAQMCRKRREELGWSQRELARRLTEDEGVSMHQSSIAKMERDDDERRPIRLAEAIALSLTLQVPVWPLFIDVEKSRQKVLEDLSDRRQEHVKTMALFEAHIADLDAEMTRLAMFDNLLISPAVDAVTRAAARLLQDEDGTRGEHQEET
ncbi:helix-turn-helix transcriptional regulator [Kineococcus endophyticus]|uniref:Helix-turn-helix transcriptional regulator n=1 Tax=Kineococcus endophyticus TaxID=1181883 RepID=A0ABV3P137_9ACTN